MDIQSIDHLVLTVASIEETVAFYTALGMEEISFAGSRKALAFGSQKINLHQKSREFEPKALSPTPGSADLCFIVATPMDQIIRELKSLNIEIIEGPVERTGARCPILSVYIRDPDKNLIELSNEL